MYYTNKQRITALKALYICVRTLYNKYYKYSVKTRYKYRIYSFVNYKAL